MEQKSPPETEPSVIKKSSSKKEKVVVVLILVITLPLIVGFCVASTFMIGKKQEISVEADNTYEEVAEDNANELPEVINFQPVIDEWATTGTRGVVIYDLENLEVVGALNASDNFSTASLYKLFVVYEGYRRLQTGEWRAEDLVGSTGHTVIECLDLAIRESNSTCAEALWRGIGYEELDNIIENDFQIFNSNISKLVSTPEDIMKMMKIYYFHQDVEDAELLAVMQDSFLNQPATEFDWRQGLPSGFSDKVKVYNKVGWQFNADENYWELYHDAAIIEFPEENRHFIVVVMTSSVDYSDVASLGVMIEKYYYQVLKN